MNKKAKQLLKVFQCDHVRLAEEVFAQTLSEDERVRLFFINEGQALTDGRNIVVDPASDELFADRPALERITRYLGWPPTILADPWRVLKLTTRAQTIHECLHILHSSFPPEFLTDPRCDTKAKRKTMSMISNVIEDVYIEAVGCSVYDNMEVYLRFGRMARLFASRPSEGTTRRMLNDEIKQEEGIPEDQRKAALLLDYLDHMVGLMLYPMLEFGPPSEAIASYVAATRQLFEEGCMAASPAERYAFSQQIFDIILPLIPDQADLLETSALEQRIGGCKTHSGSASTLGGERREGRTQAVTIRLFVDKEGRERKDSISEEKLAQLIEELSKDHDVVIQIHEYQGRSVVANGGDYDCSVLHKKIKINEVKPPIDYGLRRAYMNIHSKYKININSYSARFAQLLRARVSVREEKYRYGSGITSTRLGDPHKRYWHRCIEGVDVPDLAVLLLIDGSGSMRGERQHQAMVSAVILHEVLKKQEIQHCIVEHRGQFCEPEIDVNILVDLGCRSDEKLNLMKLRAYGDNRDALALFWAERYLVQNTSAQHRLIIVLSDGVPAHEFDHYHPPVSTKDTANAVRKITRRGTDLIAIALDDDEDDACYEQLKEIYPNLIACNDLHRLTGQILGLVARLL